MLSGLEGKLVALVADALKARTGVSVVEAAAAPTPPDPGNGLVRAGVAEVAPDTSFLPGERAFSAGNGGTKRRRLLALRFTATVEFFRRPADATDAAATAARKLLLDDIALTGHALADPLVRTGAAFAALGPDPGFDVRAFELADGTIAGEPADGQLSGTLTYAGEADVWPVGVAEDEGAIVAVDALALALPLTIRADDPVVAVGGSTTIRIRGAGARRLADPSSGARAPDRLALHVLSDLPPADRGAILSGDPGAEAGVRIVTTAEPETVAVYRAPTGSIGATRVEQVAVHLATTTGTSGLLLGSAAVLLRPGP